MSFTNQDFVISLIDGVVHLPMLPQIFIDWVFFDSAILRNSTISELAKQNKTWPQFVQLSKWPKHAQDNPLERIRLIAQCHVFCAECFGDKLHYRVYINETLSAKVYFRKQISLAEVKKQLDKVTQMVVIDVTTLRILQTYGLNSIFGTGPKYYYIPFAILGLINNHCDSQFCIITPKCRGKKFGDVVRTELEYFWNDTAGARHEEASSNPIDYAPICRIEEELFIFYGLPLGFRCLCGGGKCPNVVGVQKTVKEDVSEEEVLDAPRFVGWSWEETGHSRMSRSRTRAETFQSISAPPPVLLSKNSLSIHLPHPLPLKIGDNIQWLQRCKRLSRTTPNTIIINISTAQPNRKCDMAVDSPRWLQRMTAISKMG